MTGRCLPEHPNFEPESRYRAERLVWEALRRRLRDGDVLLHGISFVGNDGDWEVDLVLLQPEGFAIIEVKGGSVWYADGCYFQMTPEGSKVIDLADQAKSEKYLVDRFLRRNPKWGFGLVKMAHFVALPDVTLSPDESLGPALPRERIIDATDLADAAALTRRVLNAPLANLPRQGPGAAAVAQAAEILAGRGDPQREVAARRDVHARQVHALSAEQEVIIDAVATWPRFQVVGGPGSGKTYLGVEQARRWADAGLRVAFVTYSLGLTTWVARQIQNWPTAPSSRITVTTFHGLGNSWGAVAAPSVTQEDWEVRIPELMGALAADLPLEQRFDAIVVDEAQDFAALWWPPLILALRDRVAGRLAIFGDSGQAVSRQPTGVDFGPPPLQLHSNLRNSEPIGSLINSLRPSAGMRLRGGNGPAVRFVPCERTEAIHRADDAVDEVLAAGWSPADVVLLTTGHRHPLHRDVIESHGRSTYWESFWDDDMVFYSTAVGFKGLERPAVVLALNGFVAPGSEREVLLVGISRARDELVICGSADDLRTIGGREFTKRLLGSP